MASAICNVSRTLGLPGMARALKGRQITDGMQSSFAPAAALKTAISYPGAQAPGYSLWPLPGPNVPGPQRSFATVLHVPRGAPKRMKIGFADAHFGEGMV